MEHSYGRREERKQNAKVERWSDEPKGEKSLRKVRYYVFITKSVGDTDGELQQLIKVEGEPLAAVGIEITQNENFWEMKRRNDVSYFGVKVEEEFSVVNRIRW